MLGYFLFIYFLQTEDLLMFLPTDLWTAERCQSLFRTGQKPFSHLRTLTEQKSASLVCMFKSTDLTALSPTRGKEINIFKTLFTKCFRQFCIFTFSFSSNQTSLHLLPGQCTLFPASQSKNCCLSWNPHWLFGVCQEVGVSAAATAEGKHLFWSWLSECLCNFYPDLPHHIIYSWDVFCLLCFVSCVLSYTTGHIWACPPSEGDDYIFHCHPADQKIPKPKRLQEWYKKMLDKAVAERIVHDYKVEQQHLTSCV